MVSDLVTAVFVGDLQASKHFYCELLGLQPIFESDWVVQLSSSANDAIKLTLQPRDHDLVPQAFRARPQGVSVTFVVDSCDEVFKKAKDMQLEIVQAPRDEVYGQRRFLTVDPDGLLVDVSSQCEPSAEFVAKYMSGA